MNFNQLNWRRVIDMRKGSGFSLIEILVALTILAIALTACLMLTSRLTHNLQPTQDHIKAQWVAENALAKIKDGELKVTPGKVISGEEKQLASVFHYRAKIIEHRPHADAVEIQVSLDKKQLTTLTGWNFLTTEGVP